MLVSNSPAKFLDLAPVFLAGATSLVTSARVHGTYMRGHLFARFPGFRQLVEQRSGNSCRSTLLRYGFYGNYVLKRSHANPHLVARAYLPSTLDLFAVHKNLPAVERFNSKSSRLVKPRGPKPFVDSYS